MLDRTNLTNSQITGVADYWKKELGLSTWEITIKKVTQADIPDNYAEVSWHLADQTATIEIADPDTWPTGHKRTDMEDSIVHEMIHLCFAGLLSTIHEEWNLTTVQNKIVVERPTILMTAALVKLRRAGAHEFTWERKRRKSVHA